MITKANMRFIRGLDIKKNRDDAGCFIVEGDKIVREALNQQPTGRFSVMAVYATNEWLSSYLNEFGGFQTEFNEISTSDLERLSLQKTPNQVLAILSNSKDTSEPVDFQNGLYLGLDTVQDPGNVGTILRLADWFGIDGVIASADSADFFSPKVVQASMGSIFRIRLLQTDLEPLIRNAPADFPVYGTRLEGENIYESELTGHGCILLGNESKGLNPSLTRLLSKSLYIPHFTKGEAKPESLNVAIAAAVICSEFRRRGNG